MANRMPDGSVVPSFLGVQRAGVTRQTGVMNNNVLRVGEITEMFYPKEGYNVSNFIQYTVACQQSDGRTTTTTVVYPGCLLSSIFGGGADVFRYTLRDSGKESQQTLGVGSKVILLCADGRASHPIILGGLADETNNVHGPEKNEGHNLFFEFNGTTFSIDKDGQTKVQVKGATDAEGKVTTAISPEPSLEVQKDGRVYIKSAGVYIGDATDQMLLANTYRSGETELHNKMIVELTAIIAQITAETAAWAAALPLLAIPVVGGALAAPAFLPIPTIVNPAIIAQLTQMIADITTFETKAPTYLSNKNKND